MIKDVFVKLYINITQKGRVIQFGPKHVRFYRKQVSQN